MPLQFFITFVTSLIGLLFRLLSVLIMLSYSTAGWALAERLASQLESRPLPAVYAWLDAQSPPPEQQANVSRWLGQMALQLGRYAEAIEHFEQLILLEPMDLGSRLDLSIAYAEQGNRDAARASLEALYHHLGDRPLPPEAALHVVELEARLASSPIGRLEEGVRLLEGRLDVVQGYDSNANLGAKNDRIPLNLWGEIPLEAELADESLARSSHYSQYDVNARLPLSALATGEGGMEDWQLLTGISGRHYHELDSLHRRDMHLGARWQPEGLREQLNLLLLHQHVDSLEDQWSLNASYRRLIGTRWLTSLGVQRQHEPYYSASYRLQGGLWREWKRALFWGRASWQFRPDRPAGDTWRLELGGDSPIWRWRKMEIGAYASLEHRQDTEAYSRQFFGDVRRRDTIAILGSRGLLPLSANLDLVLDASWQHTSANIGLFENRRWQIETRLSWRW